MRIRCNVNRAGKLNREHPHADADAAPPLQPAM